jgi:hypothetical protein
MTTRHAPLTSLELAWARLNVEHFGGRLRRPWILLANPAVDPLDGEDYAACRTIGAVTSGAFGRTVIYVHPGLSAADRERVLRHEVVHQWQREVLGRLGHDAEFHRRAALVGAALAGEIRCP